MGKRQFAILTGRSRGKRVSCLALVLLWLFAGGYAAAAPVPPTTARVKVAVLNVRQQPNKRSRKLFSLRRGRQVVVLEERGDWLKIRAGRKKSGWVYAPLLKVSRPRKKLPAVTMQFVAVPPELREVFTGPAAGLRRALAAYKPQPLTVVVSRRTMTGQQTVHWLLVVEIPFRREEYRRLKGDNVGDGTIDLLPYLEHLKALLTYREEVAAAMIRQRGRSGAGAEPDEIAAYLGLRHDNGDLLLLTGKLAAPYAAFAPRLFIRLHGYQAIRVDALLPGCVRDFNKFVLPEPLSVDGRRTRAAAVYDFFGFGL